MDELSSPPYKVSLSQSFPSGHTNNICGECDRLKTEISRLQTEIAIRKGLDQYQTSEIRRLRTVVQRHNNAVWDRLLVYLRYVQDAVYNANRAFEQFGLNISHSDLQKLVAPLDEDAA